MITIECVDGAVTCENLEGSQLYKFMREHTDAPLEYSINFFTKKQVERTINYYELTGKVHFIDIPIANFLQYPCTFTAPRNTSGQIEHPYKKERYVIKKDEIDLYIDDPLVTIEIMTNGAIVNVHDYIYLELDVYVSKLLCGQVAFFSGYRDEIIFVLEQAYSGCTFDIIDNTLIYKSPDDKELDFTQFVEKKKVEHSQYINSLGNVEDELPSEGRRWVDIKTWQEFVFTNGAWVEKEAGFVL